MVSPPNRTGDWYAELTELFANHTFVGILDSWRRLAAIQHGVKLYLIDYGAVWYSSLLTWRTSLIAKLRILLSDWTFWIRQLWQNWVDGRIKFRRSAHSINGINRFRSNDSTIPNGRDTSSPPTLFVLLILGDCRDSSTTSRDDCWIFFNDNYSRRNINNSASPLKKLHPPLREITFFSPTSRTKCNSFSRRF